MPGGIGAEGRQVDDRHLRHEIRQGGTIRADQQIADEQGMPGKFSDDARVQSVLFIGAADESAQTVPCPLPAQ